MKHFYLKTFLLCLFALAGTKVMAYDCEVDGIYYNLDDDNAIVTYRDNTFNSYSGAIYIPATIIYGEKQYFVRCIGCNAFRNCNKLTSITIGYKQFGNRLYYYLKEIDTNAFYGCSALSEFVDSFDRFKNHISPGVQRIGQNAFYNCKSLNSLTIPVSVISIEDNVFQDCSSLSSVTIPENVTSIGQCAFRGCSSLTSIIVDKNNPIYDSRDSCNAIIKTTSNTIIAACNSTIIPNSVTGIGYCAFAGCRGLTQVIIPSSVTSIGSGAFAGCTGLTSMKIPNSIITIGSEAFHQCENMTSINIPERVKIIEKWTFGSCRNLTSITIPTSVTTIDDAFPECDKLTKVTLNSDSIVSKRRTSSESLKSTFGPQVTNYVIGDNVKEIGDYAFYGCSSLNDIAIGKGVTSIGNRAFMDCSGLSSITFPNSLTSFGYDVFQGCNNLGTLVLPDNVTKFDSNFPSYTKLYVNRGTISLLSLWQLGYKPYDKIKESLLLPPTIKYSSTQTTVKVWVDNIYDEYEYHFERDYNSIIGNEVVFNKLFPENTYTINMYVWDKERMEKYYFTYLSTYTKNISPSVKIDGTTASSIKAVGFYEKGDVNVVSENINLNGVQMNGHEISITGLDPVKDYLATYNITVSNGLTTKKYTGKSYFRTNTLSITTSQPKVISSGNVIVAAQTNLDEEETSVGFEWRRTDWTDDFASNTGTAALYEGTMEGYIRNLNTEKLWKYRPYYLSNSGTYYYGDWVGIDPTNTSYFEPTVHTYAKIEIEGNTALVKGYALRGTDNVTVQGFMYWKDANKAKAALAPRRATEIPEDAMMVKATGQTMTATLKNLDYESTYEYVAFVTTSEGETFYGDVRSFTTSADPTGIENVELTSHETVTEVARYDLSGHRLTSPHRGINIVRMSDGTVRKVMVK